MGCDNCERLVPPLLDLYPEFYACLNKFCLKKCGITKTQLTAILLLNCSGTLTMGNLAARLGIPKEQATRAVAPLVERNLLERCTNEANRRRIDIRISESGRRFLSELKNEYIDSMRASCGNFTNEEVTAFLAAIDRLRMLLAKISL